MMSLNSKAILDSDANQIYNNNINYNNNNDLCLVESKAFIKSQLTEKKTHRYTS